METDRIRLKLYLVVFTVLMFVGISGFMLIEDLSLVDSIYFSVVTMATVGYGDIHPQSTAGKILALVLIVGGVGTFLGVVASITDIFLKRREDAFRRQKLNMVAGLFYSEMGTALLRHFASLDSEIIELKQILKVSKKWENKDFHKAKKRLEKHRFIIDSRRGDLLELREYLQKRADFLLRILENPTLQEHGNFTDLLRAVFHLRDELLNRVDLSEMPETDRQHLEGDILRIYKLLVLEWLSYMRYLKENYGYLFSLALRVNPFDPEASPVVKSS
ncbi:MAG: two pore domain potassium channel family protein [Deltaproteobacteria bacterium]|nr:two pore domain potassium channel family protein [Deltaproteobacteria bacterium]